MLRSNIYDFLFKSNFQKKSEKFSINLENKKCLIKRNYKLVDDKSPCLKISKEIINNLQ